MDIQIIQNNIYNHTFLYKEKNMSNAKDSKIFAFGWYANYICTVFTNGREPTEVSDAEPI